MDFTILIATTVAAQPITFKTNIEAIMGCLTGCSIGRKDPECGQTLASGIQAKAGSATNRTLTAEVRQSY